MGLVELMDDRSPEKKFLDAMFEATTPPNPAAPAPRKCPHPRRDRLSIPAGDGQPPVKKCGRCNHVFDPGKVRRGRAARSKGIRGELRSRNRYGWVKVGQHGGITDLRGTMMKVQQKTSGTLPPARWRAIFRELDSVRDGRIPAILLSYVRQGIAADDYIVIRGADWLSMHGIDQPPEVPE